MLAPALLLALAATPASVAAPPPASPIVGGEVTPPGAYPEVVSIIRGPYRCTGTLLAPDLVLTAAHCFGDGSVQPSGLLVTTGESADQPGAVLTVADYGMHPQFCSPEDDPECVEQIDIFDFAWIRLTDPVPLPPERIPAVVIDEALHHRLVRVGAELLLVGYGEDDDGQLGLKREVTAEISALSSTGWEVRAGGDGRDSCRGDSGGPAFARLDDGSLALVGVLSRGGECGVDGGLYGATLAGLCWVRDDSGASVVPEGCEDCDCVDLTPRQEDPGCAACRSSGQRASLGVWVLLVAMLGRRRCPIR